MKDKKVLVHISILALLGFLDSFYLTLEHYQQIIVPCSLDSIFIDCGGVLRSKYSEIFGIPVAVLGMVHYGVFTAASLHAHFSKKRLGKIIALLLGCTGLVASSYFIYLQFFVLNSICLFCTASALISFLLFTTTQRAFSKERKRVIVWSIGFIYKNILKPIIFLFDSEMVHDAMTDLGEKMGGLNVVKVLNKSLVRVDDSRLSQKIANIKFENPIGLAAGFDYEARFTQILPSLGFGFMTGGTITNMAYVGNPKPRLGRLPNSKSLLVNKGFKSSGADVVSSRLSKLKFDAPLGISIGRTNSAELKTQKQSIKNIISAFKKFEKVKVKNSYYELNISCPNLIHGDISFYPPRNLNQLLVEIDKLKLKKPIFVKMPIIKTNKETLKMLGIIAKYSPVGVIFGNLQMDRKHPDLDLNEVKKFKMGYFSGKPTYKRSNELIKLSYKHFKDRFIIIGCGGVFNGKDAYEKITLGASLVQLITGLIYKGPQLASQINFELLDLMEKDGFGKISEAIGTKNK
jgi:dihydroorotate dehydrogenase